MSTSLPTLKISRPDHDYAGADGTIIVTVSVIEGRLGRDGHPKVMSRGPTGPVGLTATEKTEALRVLRVLR